MQIDTDATVQGTTMSLNHVRLTFDNSTNVSMVGELSMLGKSPRFWADAQIECAAADGIPQVKNISNIEIAGYGPSLSAGTLKDIADAINKAIQVSEFTIPLSADLTGIDVITEGGEAKLEFSWSGGSLTWTKSDIEGKLDTAASNLESQANDYISNGYDDGKWSLNVTIGGGKLTFNAQATLFGITAKIQNMDITFPAIPAMTASTTNATVSLGSNQATFSATADIACTDYVPSLTVTSLSLGDEYPTLRDWINDTDINAALRDGLNQLVTDTVTNAGLRCRLATFDHIAITDSTIRIWLEALSLVRGVTGEVNCEVLPGVALELYKDGVEVDSDTSDVSGNYELTATETGDYTVTASKSGFRDETQTISVTDLGQEYTLNFLRDHALVPNAPDMSYALLCIHHWKYPSPECGISMSKALSVVHAWKYPIVA